MAKIYYRAVKSGKRTLESVPERWRDEVRQMLIQESGKHFDPDVVKAFLAREADFVHVAEKFADPAPAPSAAMD